jgi:hypothetical protein
MIPAGIHEHMGCVDATFHTPTMEAHELGAKLVRLHHFELFAFNRA